MEESEVVDTQTEETATPAVDNTETGTDSSVESTENSQETASDDGVALVKEAKPAVPAYTPDYKLKVYDEEKELDDPFLKALIKDPETEKKVKEIAQKALGFDVVKTRHEKTKSDFQGYQQQTKPIMDIYNAYQNKAQKGDLDGIFEILGIPQQTIFQYALQKAQEQQLPIEQQRQIQQQRQIEREREQLANQNQSLQQNSYQQLVDFRNQELSWTMQRPDVQGVAQAFDAKNGANSFRELVRNQALAHYTSTQGREDLTAEQAVQKVMQMIGGFVQPANLNGSPAPQPGTQNLIQQNGAPPIIPNVQGRGSSPVKKQVRSVADLKKRREEILSR